MAVPRLSLGSVELRVVSFPPKRPVVSKVGLFDRWPLVVIDLRAEDRSRGDGGCRTPTGYHKTLPRGVLRLRSYGFEKILLLKYMATPAGFEPATTRLEGECSIQLSYGVGSRATALSHREPRAAIPVCAHVRTRS